MATSSIPSQAPRSVLSYQDNLWHISWGEQDCIAAVKEEMKQALAQGNSSVQPEECSTSSCQVPTQSQPQMMQAVGFMMTRMQSADGTQCDVPALVFTAQQD